MSGELLTMIVPVKADEPALHLRHPKVEQIEIHGPLESIAAGFLEATRKAETDWVIFANDDIAISPQRLTPPFSGEPARDWVEILEDEIAHLPDPYWLLHPD